MATPCQRQCGTLTAEWDGPNVTLTVGYTDDYQHAFSVDYLAGEDQETGEDVWVGLKFNGHRMVRGDTALDTEVPYTRTYRALIYRETDEVPKMLHTNGNYTPPVTV